MPSFRQTARSAVPSFSMKPSNLLLLLPLCLMAGCSTASFPIFHPQGEIGDVQWRYTLIVTFVMMLIIGPVLILTFLFMWRYRVSRKAAYDPNWSHSMPLELTMWGIPILIVAFLGFASYRSTLLVNPFGPLALKMDNPANPPLEVDVITTDWQWVFIYPQYHVATVDDLPVIAGRPVKLFLTSTSVTNDFYIPQVAPMIDVMPGMRTADAFQVDHTGAYEGYSANFSGEGFSWMQFSTRVLSPADFSTWAATAAASPNQLSYAAFGKLAEPTVNIGARPAYFSNVDPGLFRRVYEDAQAGKVYVVQEHYKIPASTVDYTQGNNARN